MVARCSLRTWSRPKVRWLRLCEMKESRFYRYSLVLPLVIPALVAPLLFLDFHLLPDNLALVVMFIAYSGMVV